GQWRTIQWATPLPDRTLGLIILAVLLAGWRCGLAHRNWSWTNVAGWMLCAFWVGMAACSWLLAPGPPATLAALRSWTAPDAKISFDGEIHTQGSRTVDPVKEGSIRGGPPLSGGFHLNHGPRIVDPLKHRPCGGFHLWRPIRPAALSSINRPKRPRPSR